MATADQKTIQWPQDSTTVDINRDDALEFWSKRFGVSPGKLKQAVRTVGSKYKDVDFHLKTSTGNPRLWLEWALVKMGPG